MRSFDQITSRIRQFLRVSMRGNVPSQTHQQRLAAAWKCVEEYKRSGDPKYMNGDILEITFLRELSKQNVPPETCLTNAMKAAREFIIEEERRAIEWAQRPALKVSFFDESEWQTSWVEERRLTILITPEINKSFNGSITIKEKRLSFNVQNQLNIVARIADFGVHDKRYIADLWHPTIERRMHWQVSQVSLSESREAVELGMQVYSRKTEISTNIALNRATFDFLKERLDRCASEPVNAESLLLACGIPVPPGKIPRSRPITRHEKILDPVSLTTEPRRMSFEIAALFGVGDEQQSQRLETLARWMAIEG